MQGSSTTYLSEHLREVIYVGGTHGLSLVSLQLQVILGDIWGAEQQSMQWALLGSIGLEHHLWRKGV